MVGESFPWSKPNPHAYHAVSQDLTTYDYIVQEQQKERERKERRRKVDKVCHVHHHVSVSYFSKSWKTLPPRGLMRCVRTVTGETSSEIKSLSLPHAIFALLMTLSQEKSGSRPASVCTGVSEGNVGNGAGKT